MNIAVTGASGYLGRALVPVLANKHFVFPSDLYPHDKSIMKADVLDVAQMEKICEGKDHIIHLACDSSEARHAETKNPTQVLETRLKGTYNVMRAALGAGVSQVIQVSDLCIFSGYEPELIISEDFVPLPNTSAMEQGIYLSEMIGREFSRHSSGFVLTLRLGQLVETENLTHDAVISNDSLSLDDAINAILRGLMLQVYDRPSHWGIYNLASENPQNRFPITKIKSGLYNFTPQENFSKWLKKKDAL